MWHSALYSIYWGRLDDSWLDMLRAPAVWQPEHPLVGPPYIVFEKPCYKRGNLGIYLYIMHLTLFSRSRVTNVEISGFYLYIMHLMRSLSLLVICKWRESY